VSALARLEALQARIAAIRERAIVGDHDYAYQFAKWCGRLVADARMDHRIGYDRDDVKAWVATYARPGWVMVGHTAEVLHGKQDRCPVIEWHTGPLEGDEIWLPWLGCHVAPPADRCHFCGEVDIDHGFLPCHFCGFEGNEADAAEARRVASALEVQWRARQYARKGMLRDKARRQARADKVLART
jgi:hypothetical protein